ncbi:DNA recombination/repair protein RecA, partial [Mycoplasmopsis pullorum]
MIENKNIKSALNEIEKKFGKESIMVLGDIPNADVEVFSSGSILLDNALGINGLP